MTKRSTNLNRWRKTGTAADVADLMTRFGVTADDLRKYSRSKANTKQMYYKCPRCSQVCDSQVNLFDGSTTCPACENNITIDVSDYQS
jgi:Zn finger protein HypA/HybF involved in hydrogenase expression